MTLYYDIGMEGLLSEDYNNDVFEGPRQLIFSGGQLRSSYQVL